MLRASAQNWAAVEPGDRPRQSRAQELATHFIIGNLGYSYGVPSGGQ